MSRTDAALVEVQSDPERRRNLERYMNREARREKRGARKERQRRKIRG